MKKKIIPTLFILLLVGCNKNENSIKENIIINENTTKEIQEKEQKYIDNNNITISLYKEFNNNHEREIVTNYNSTWIQYTDIISLVAFASNENTISGDTFQTVWYNYWNKFNTENYKIGYHIYFETKNESINKTILEPNDGLSFYDYIQIYLYDDIHQEIGAWYSHVEQDEYNSNTMLTSIKLTASTKIDEITSPIKVMVFTYDNDDFDTNNDYRGNSKYEVTINNLK